MSALGDAAAGDDARAAHDALASAQQEAQRLQLELESTRTLAVAVGILMARLRVDASSAQEALTTLAALEHRDPVALARDVLQTGRLRQ